MLQARMPKVVPGALLVELRPFSAISLVFVTIIVNALNYICRMPSASATVIKTNDGSYQYRFVADQDSSLVSTSSLLLQFLVSRVKVINFYSALHLCRRTNQSSKLFLARSLICPSQSNLEFAGYIAMASGHNVSAIFALI